MATSHDPVQTLAMALVQCRDAGRTVRERITSLEAKLSKIEPPVAKTLVRIKEELGRLDPDITQLVEKLESKTDPVRWYWKQGGS